MKRNFRFNSNLRPEEMAACIAANLNIPLKPVWQLPPKEIWQELRKPLAAQKPGDDYVGSVEGLRFTLKSRNSKNDFMSMEVKGDILPGSPGSVVQAVISFDITMPLFTTIGAWALLVWLFSQHLEHYSFDGKGDVGGMVFWMAIAFPALAIGKIKWEMVQLKKYFAEIASPSLGVGKVRA